MMNEAKVAVRILEAISIYCLLKMMFKLNLYNIVLSNFIFIQNKHYFSLSFILNLPSL